MDRLLQDLRYGLRSFVRQPGFTLTAILALGIGIGANTAVFSVVYGVLIRPLPFPESDRLVFVEDTHAAIETLLYEVRPSDPGVIAATSAGVFVVAILASVVPALRALRIDPMIALRTD